MLLYIFAHNSKLILLQRASLAGIGSQLSKELKNGIQIEVSQVVLDLLVKTIFWLFDS